MVMSPRYKGVVTPENQNTAGSNLYPAPRTQAAIRPDPQYAKDMGIAADLRADMALDTIIRKWRTTGDRVEWLRAEMGKGRYGGWLRA
jgi:hypothetical protein